jgi:hypothetical protein
MRKQGILLSCAASLALAQAFHPAEKQPLFDPTLADDPSDEFLTKRPDLNCGQGFHAADVDLGLAAYIGEWERDDFVIVLAVPHDRPSRRVPRGYEEAPIYPTGPPVS